MEYEIKEIRTYGVLAQDPKEINRAYLKVLFPGWNVGTLDVIPPKNWHAWRKPLDEIALPLDRRITKAIDRSKASKEGLGRMRAPDELRLLGIECPYYSARYFTALALTAADRVRAEHEHGKKVRAPRLKKKAGRAKALAKQLEDFAESCDLHDWLPLTGRYADRPNFDQINNFLDLGNELLGQLEAAVKTFKAIEEITKVRSVELAPKNRHGDVRATAFVAHMSHRWRELTGDDPESSSQPFKNFLTDAYESVFDKEIETRRWNSQIDRVIDHVVSRPEWDRFDRTERRTRPPGAENITWEENRRALVRGQASWERDMREVVDGARQGNTLAGKLLDQAYVLQGLTGRSFLRSLLTDGEWLLLVCRHQQET